MPNPALTTEEIEIIFTRLNPWLQTGLSINKSCQRAEVPPSTVYDLIKENALFAEKVNTARNQVAFDTNDVLTFALKMVAGKVRSGESLGKGEIAFVQWFALNNNLTIEEYGERKNLVVESPEDRIKRLDTAAEERTIEAVQESV